jgi:ATP-binding cassette subfamily B protein
VCNADRIIVLDDGAVVEAGTHEELLALQGRYAALVRGQQPVLPASGPRTGAKEETTLTTGLPV